MQKLIDGVLVNLTSEEVAERNSDLPLVDAELLVRGQRDRLLRASDVYALADRMTPAWASYRQALRDITAQEGFPYSVVWPTKPE